MCVEHRTAHYWGPGGYLQQTLTPYQLANRELKGRLDFVYGTDCVYKDVVLPLDIIYDVLTGETTQVEGNQDRIIVGWRIWTPDWLASEMEVDGGDEHPLRALHGFGSIQTHNGVGSMWNMYGLFSYYDHLTRFDPTDEAFFRWLPIRQHASTQMVMEFLFDNHQVHIPKF